MIINAFYFLNELDLLEIRLRELQDVVDLFVLVEGTKTYRGEPKPAHFYENRKRFAPWLSKIRNYVVTDYPYGGQSSLRATWAREFHQRDCLRRALPKVASTDVVVLTDGDEIPRATTVRDYSASQGIVNLDMRFYHFYLNYKANNGWAMAHIFPGDVYNAIQPTKLRLIDTTRIPFLPFTPDSTAPDAGWHFAYLGGLEGVKYKLKSYSHWNINHNLPTLAAIQRGMPVDLARLGVQSDGARYVFSKVAVDAGHPRFVEDNVPLFKERGLILE